MKVNFSDCFHRWYKGIIQTGTLVSVLKGDIPMTNKEKLIEYIHNLTNEEADYIISYLTKSASFEEASLHLPQNNSPQVQEVAF